MNPRVLSVGVAADDQTAGAGVAIPRIATGSAFALPVDTFIATDLGAPSDSGAFVGHAVHTDFRTPIVASRTIPTPVRRTVPEGGSFLE